MSGKPPGQGVQDTAAIKRRRDRMAESRPLVEQSNDLLRDRLLRATQYRTLRPDEIEVLRQAFQRNSTSPLSEFHRQVAVHCLYLRAESEQKKPEKEAVAQELVAKMWGISTASVHKHVREYRKDAMATVNAFLADQDQTAVQAHFAMMADAFIKLAE